MSDKYPTDQTRVSYGIGRQMGDQLIDNPFDGMSLDAVLEGLTDALNGQPSPVSAADLEAAFKTVSEQMRAEKSNADKALAADGAVFLEKNALRDEVNVTASGLQYEIITEGAGEKPQATSNVRTHYHGTLIDGSVFDSSYERGQPAEFPVNGVIAGWTEALMMMGVGSKWRLYLPYNLAYGEHGAGGSIGPYATLIFDVELLDIVS
ncbi:MAG TPA: FKBP-type peptidyl-prolyl cis-trans isomerase [Pseudomonadales bacterium]